MAYKNTTPIPTAVILHAASAAVKIMRYNLARNQITFQLPVLPVKEIIRPTTEDIRFISNYKNNATNQHIYLPPKM
jgi:hypothetical protein